MDGIGAYKENAVAVQTQGRVIVLLYEGAIKFLKQAIAETEAEQWAAKGEHIGKAIDIIGELDAVLDMEAGAEVAHNLRRLYDFMLGHLMQAHVNNDTQMMREVVAILEDLNEGWKVVAE